MGERAGERRLPACIEILSGHLRRSDRVEEWSPPAGRIRHRPAHGLNGDFLSLPMPAIASRWRRSLDDQRDLRDAAQRHARADRLLPYVGAAGQRYDLPDRRQLRADLAVDLAMCKQRLRRTSGDPMGQTTHLRGPAAECHRSVSRHGLGAFGTTRPAHPRTSGTSDKRTNGSGRPLSSTDAYTNVPGGGVGSPAVEREGKSCFYAARLHGRVKR